jgi:hypothetical protein
MDPTDMYNPERIQKISEIMPRFNAHVQPNDEIMFGLEGDPMFPQSFAGNRPTGVVQKVKNSGGSAENATIRVKMNNGQVKDIPYGSVNPETLWEFTDESFQKVLKRSIDRNMPEETPEYRGATDLGSVESLRAELNALKGSMDAERAETQNFNNALIATIHEIAGDVCKASTKYRGATDLDSGDESFCSVFNKEYNKMMSNNDAPNPEYGSAFDSDFSSSDVDEVN